MYSAIKDNHTELVFDFAKHKFGMYMLVRRRQYSTTHIDLTSSKDKIQYILVYLYQVI